MIREGNIVGRREHEKKKRRKGKGESMKEGKKDKPRALCFILHKTVVVNSLSEDLMLPHNTFCLFVRSNLDLKDNWRNYHTRF